MKKTVVLHICCAPDEAWGIRELQSHYDLICFFCNPNISPVQEYELRLQEAEKVARQFCIPFESDKYDPDSWENTVAPYVHTPEGGERCRACFLLRLRRTSQFCKQKNIESFTSVMSVSPHKSIKMLNETGHIAASEHNMSYLETDLKKNNGFQKSIVLSKELSLYRQDYCGCRLSKAERDLRVEKRAAKNRIN
jgi:epoxyqueuosine reductase